MGSLANLQESTDCTWITEARKALNCQMHTETVTERGQPGGNPTDGASGFEFSVSGSVSLGLAPCQSGFHWEPSGSLFSVKTRYRSAWQFPSKSSLIYHLLSNSLHCLELPVSFALSLERREGRKEGREGGGRIGRRERGGKEGRKEEGCPGGSVVKNPAASAGDTGSLPALGGSHIPWSSQVHAPQLLSLCPGAQELQLLQPMHLDPTLHHKRSNGEEKPVHRS